MSLVPAEGKDLDHQEGHRDTKDGSNDIADDIREAEHIVENHDDDVLDDIVWYVGNCEFYITLQR